MKKQKTKMKSPRAQAWGNPRIYARWFFRGGWNLILKNDMQCIACFHRFRPPEVVESRATTLYIWKTHFSKQKTYKKHSKNTLQPPEVAKSWATTLYMWKIHFSKNKTFKKHPKDLKKSIFDNRSPFNQLKKKPTSNKIKFQSPINFLKQDKWKRRPKWNFPKINETHWNHG